MKILRSQSQVTVLCFSVLSLSACGQSVMRSGGVQSSLDDGVNQAAIIPTPTPTPTPTAVVRTSSIRCRVYDLAPYYVRQGCLSVLPNSLNDRQYGYSYSSLSQCGMTLPVDFASLDGYRGEISLPNFDIEPRDWQHTFPGFPRELEDLKEWYGISCTGTITVPQDLRTKISLSSDDGAKLFIDGRLAVDNGGILHATTTAISGVTLSRGSHPIHLVWFQGPRVEYSLRLKWTYRNSIADTSSSNDFDVVSHSYFLNP
jgi:hypothetical protein